MNLLNKFRIILTLNLSLLSIVSTMLIMLLGTGCESKRRAIEINAKLNRKI